MDAGPASRREQAERRRAQLIDVAMSVFSTKGIDAASMKEIAAGAGVAPGLLYHYFEGKEALVLAVIAERGFLPELRRLLSVVGDRPAREVLPDILENFGRLLAERAELVTLFFTGASTNPKIKAGLEAFVAEGQQLLADYLASRVGAGELREHDVKTAAKMLLATCVLGHLTGAPAEPRSATRVVLEGLTADTTHASETEKG